MKELEKRIAALEEIVRLQGLTIARLQSTAPMPKFGPQVPVVDPRLVQPVVPIFYPCQPPCAPGDQIPPYVVTCGSHQ